MPSFRVIVSVGRLHPGVDPRSIEPAAADAARELAVVEASSVDVVAGEARLTVRFTEDTERSALRVAEHTVAHLTRSPTSAAGGSPSASAAAGSAAPEPAARAAHAAAGSDSSISPTIAGSSGSVWGRKRCTTPSGVTTNFSKFHFTLPALPSASGALVSSW